MMTLYAESALLSPEFSCQNKFSYRNNYFLFSWTTEEEGRTTEVPGTFDLFA